MIGRTLAARPLRQIQGIIVFFISIAAGFQPTSLAFLPVGFADNGTDSPAFTAMGTADSIAPWRYAGIPDESWISCDAIFFLSGGLFPAEGLPGSIFICSKREPAHLGVDGLRGALGGQMHFGFGIDLAVLTGVTALFLVIEAICFSKLRYNWQRTQSIAAMIFANFAYWYEIYYKRTCTNSIRTHVSEFVLVRLVSLVRCFFLLTQTCLWILTLKISQEYRGIRISRLVNDIGLDLFYFFPGS